MEDTGPGNAALDGRFLTHQLRINTLHISISPQFKPPTRSSNRPPAVQSATVQTAPAEMWPFQELTFSNEGICESIIVHQ